MSKLFIFLLSFNCFLSQAQSFDFECNTLPESKHSNEITVHNAFIDTTKIDFELKLWHHTLGLSGESYKIFVLRHYNRNLWRAFLFDGSKNQLDPKNMDEYFAQYEIKQSKSQKWQPLWDSLASSNILTISPPSNETLERLMNKNNPRYPEIIHSVEISDSGDDYTIELTNKKCKRRTFWNYTYLSLDFYTQLSEVKSFKEIQNILNNRFSNF